MIQGYLYINRSEEQIKEDISKNSEISLGVDVASILDTITLHEINNNSEREILNLLKKELMIYLGKIKVEEPKNESKRKNKEN